MNAVSSDQQHVWDLFFSRYQPGNFDSTVYDPNIGEFPTKDLVDTVQIYHVFSPKMWIGYVILQLWPFAGHKLGLTSFME